MAGRCRMNRANVRKVISAHLERPATRLLVGLGLNPNAITLLGLVVAGASAYLLSVGLLALGGVVLLVSGVFDLFDGAVARATGRVSAFGALLDSTVDRVAEAVVMLGVLAFYLGRDDSTTGAILVYVAMVGSIMVSYTRARAEGLDVPWKGGVMTRPERVVVLGVGTIAGQWWLPSLSVALGAIAALTFLTSVQRVLHVRRVLSDREASGPPRPE